MKLRQIPILLLLLCITACSPADMEETAAQPVTRPAATEEITETEALEEPTDRSGNPLNQDWISNSLLWKDPFPDRELLDTIWDTGYYIPYKELDSASKVLNAVPLQVPETINGHKINDILTYYYADGLKCIVELENESRDIGIYDFSDKTYQMLFSSAACFDYDADGHCIMYEGCCGHRFFFYSYIPLWATSYNGHIWMYDFEKTELKRIYDYNYSSVLEPGMKEDACQAKHFLAVNDRFYFQESLYDSVSETYDSVLYYYDIAGDAVALEREEAQEPLLYGDSYACFVKDASGTYQTLIDSSGNIIWKKDEYGGWIASNGTQVYMVGRATDFEKEVTRDGLILLDRDREFKDYILMTYSSIAPLEVNEKWVLMGMCVFGNVGRSPIIYSITDDIIYELDMLPRTKGYFYFRTVEGSCDSVIYVDGQPYWLTQKDTES